MSLFIGSLAFEETGSNLLFDERVGILAGSLLSGDFLGHLVLHKTLPERQRMKNSIAKISNYIVKTEQS